MRRMFSKKQIERMVAENPAAVIEALQNQDITCKELKEEFDTELIDFSEYILTDFAKTHSFYAKIQVKHNTLFIVLSGSFVAGESASTNPNLTSNIMALIPENIKSKIFRMDGTNLTQARDTLSYVSFNSITKRVASIISGSSVALDSSSSSELKLAGYSFGTIAEDTVCQLDYRLFLAL